MVYMPEKQFLNKDLLYRQLVLDMLNPRQSLEALVIITPSETLVIIALSKSSKVNLV